MFCKIDFQVFCYGVDNQAEQIVSDVDLYSLDYKVVSQIIF